LFYTYVIQFGFSDCLFSIAMIFSSILSNLLLVTTVHFVLIVLYFCLWQFYFESICIYHLSIYPAYVFLYFLDHKKYIFNSFLTSFSSKLIIYVFLGPLPIFSCLWIICSCFFAWEQSLSILCCCFLDFVWIADKKHFVIYVEYSIYMYIYLQNMHIRKKSQLD
jgi:hypothetical protein